MQPRTTSIAEVAKLSVRDRRVISTNVQPEPDKLSGLIDTVRAPEAAGVPYALIGGLFNACPWNLR